MARQQLVRALVPEDAVETLREEVLAIDGADVTAVTVSAPDPATYRDERPDLQLRELVKGGRTRLALGIVVGAAIGMLIAFAIPVLREWMPYTLLLFAFGGGWGGAITAVSRGIQKDKPEDDTPEEVISVDEQDAEELRVMTVVVQHDRDAVVDLLTERGIVLLDSWHPKVGRGPDARPAESPDEEGPRRAV